MNPKISVIIPTYNAENYLMSAVDSVIKQSIGFDNIELILVDDKSTDGTRDILERLDGQYSNIKTIFLEENSGSPSKPRNIGIKKAESDYIMFLDNDDTYCGDFCQKMYETIEKYDSDIVGCRQYLVYENRVDKSHSFLDKRDKFIRLNSIEDDKTLLSHTNLHIWNKIYKKSLLLENNIEFPIGTLYEDVYFNLLSYLKAEGIVFLNDYWGYNYALRQSGDDKSTSQDFKKENLVKFYNGLKMIFAFLDEENKDFRNFEAEMLIGFTKWLLLTECEIDYKLKIFNEFKKYYKRFRIFTRVEFIPLYQNIPINVGIKFINLNNFCFKLVEKMINIIL